MLRALYRSSPFRLMALISIAFVVFLVLAGSAAFFLIRNELNSRVEEQLLQSFAVISQSYNESDLADLTDLVGSNATANGSREHVFLLRDSSGIILAGNISAGPAAVGWSTASAGALGLTDHDGPFRIYSDVIGGSLLTVGASFDETDAVSAIVLSSLSMAGIAFVVLITAAAVLIARRGQRRIDGIVETMAAIGRGELSARIPVRRVRDDLDDLSIQINHALERLAGLVEGMRQVSVDIAHDLKTPLNRLSFTIENAIENEEARRLVAPLLQRAREEVRQINTTFEALLRIAQIESGARRARFKTVAVETIFEDLFDAYAGVAEENGQTLRFDECDTFEIPGDRELLTQLFANLIENAIRHCTSGTAISLRLRCGNDGCHASVSDNGSGIPASEHHKVFQRLYRLDKSRNTPGHGLGLSLVKAIADLHGATITIADNQPGLMMDLAFPNGKRPQPQFILEPAKDMADRALHTQPD